MTSPQPGILAPVPPHSRYLEFRLKHDCDPRAVIETLASEALDERTIVGFGPALVNSLGGHVDGLHPFPNYVGIGCSIPATQADLWIWIRGDDRGKNLHLGRTWSDALAPAFDIERSVDGFMFDRGLDLTGYEDGTENPRGNDADKAAIVSNSSARIEGSSFVAVQQWVHDLSHFGSLVQTERDNIIGRRLSDNEEIEEAPTSAHVKRTEQESFEPHAHVLRRSMPWANANGEGLMFVAFGHTLEAFEAQLSRMTGQDDTIVDGLFRFTRPISGSYFWCPALVNGKLDLTPLSD